MQVQTVIYELDGISEDEYLDLAARLAPRYASMPGLQAKLWLENAAENTYGAVYFWEDEESMERYRRSDLFEGANPVFDNVISEGFSVLQNLTRATQPVLEVLRGDRQPLPNKPILGRTGSGGGAEVRDGTAVISQRESADARELSEGTSKTPATRKTDRTKPADRTKTAARTKQAAGSKKR